ncbi:MAG: magnesium transporter [Promethearchaeota archaeon]
MEQEETKGRIVKETFPFEIISIIGDIFAGIILTLLILPFKSFSLLIFIIPPLFSLRGNITAPFVSRTARDLIIGEFNLKSFLENTLATYVLGEVTAILIGFLSVILNLFIYGVLILPFWLVIMIPILTILFTLSLTIPISVFLNYISFKIGLNPNNGVHPVMTAVGDFSMIICFFITIILLGVS